MKVTIAQIKEADPCDEGWDDFIDNNPNSDLEKDVPFEVSSILMSNSDEDDIEWVIESTQTTTTIQQSNERIASYIAIKETNHFAIDYLIKYRNGDIPCFQSLRYSEKRELRCLFGPCDVRWFYLLKYGTGGNNASIIGCALRRFDITREEIKTIIDKIQ